jgi:septal ring factor EnvC (AmiA/AmiB activator)
MEIDMERLKSENSSLKDELIASVKENSTLKSEIISINKKLNQLEKEIDTLINNNKRLSSSK